MSYVFTLLPFPAIILTNPKTVGAQISPTEDPQLVSFELPGTSQVSFLFLTIWQTYEQVKTD
jgi:hypothetical protein